MTSNKPTIDVNMLRDLTIAMNNLVNADTVYTLHYDETNNIRRLHLTGDGLNVKDLHCFVLGGIAHRGTPPELNFEDLKKVFKLQKSTQELKLVHLGKGDFLNLLNSQKIEKLLDWLHDQELFLHYQVIDPFYWSIVDVVDSILTDKEKVHLLIQAPNLKNSLYTILRTDIEATAALLKGYNYPNVGAARRVAFITDLLVLAEEQRTLLSSFEHQMLKGLLQLATELQTLPYLEYETPNMLIDSLGGFYLDRIALFKNSIHILDIEQEIEAYLLGYDLRDGAATIGNYSFVDSKDRPWVQVSDATVGFLGKFFSFVNRTPAAELKEIRSTFTDRQDRSLRKLSDLLARSIEECPAFAQYLVSLQDHTRRICILGF